MQLQAPPAAAATAVAGPSSSATEQEEEGEEEEEAAAVLPSLEALLSVPLAFVARHTSNRREAEALLQVSLLAARLDSLLACLGMAARQAARAHGQAQAIQRVPNSRVRTLLPLLRELELQRRHDLRALREETEECAQALERHKEMFTWSACTHASHAEQVQSFMPHLAQAARRMVAVFQEVVARLDTLLLPETHAVPSPSSFPAHQQQPCFSLYQHCRRADNGQGWVTMAEFVAVLERGGVSPNPSQASPASRRAPVPAATIGRDGAGEETQAHPQQQANPREGDGAASSSSMSSVHGAEPCSTSSSSSTTMSGGDGGGVCLPSASKKRSAAGAGLAAEVAAKEGEGKEGAKEDQTHGSGAEEEEAAEKRTRTAADGQQQPPPPSIKPALTPSVAAPPLPPPLSPAPSPALQLDAGVTPQHSETQRSTRTVLDEEEDEEDQGGEGQVEEDGGPDDVIATALDGGAQDLGDTAAPFFTAAAPEPAASAVAADSKLPPAYPLSGIVLLTSSSSSSSSSGAAQQGMVGARERFSQGSATSSQ